MGDPMEWADQFRQLNDQGPAKGNGKVVLAHLHPGDVSTSFAHSLIDLMVYDSGRRQRLAHQARLGFSSQQTAAGRIASARNQATAQFLDDFDAEWFLFVDSDMGWDPDAVDKLIAAADPVDRPVMGALCFGAKLAGQGAAHAMRVHFFPTLYKWVDTADGKSGFEASYQWPRGEVVQVDGTGGAFLLMHRRVLEEMRADEGDTWFSHFAEGENNFGEDLAFCRRLMLRGVPLHVHTGVGTSHRKEVWVDEGLFDQLRRAASPAVSVVIPVKDNWEMTRTLVAQLVEQGGYDDLLIFDNGSTDPAMRSWLDGPQQVASVFDAAGASLHDMWNAGIEEARARHKGRADVVFLNNDLRIGPDFLQRLTGGLRSNPQWLAVCGNYDARPGHGVVPVRGICANRYDGSGGLAGFAFIVRSDFLAEYRFPTEMKYWYGDNDLCLSMEQAGGAYGVVVDALVEHLGGGSNTETPEGWEEIIAADRAAFLERWPEVKLVAA